MGEPAPDEGEVMSHRESAAKGPDGRLVDRMLFFSDAVFAIVLTLLVIELHPFAAAPGAAGFEAEIRTTIQHIVVFAMSFALVAIFWAAHLQLTRRLIQFDWPSAWANLVFLFPITLMPFASANLIAHGISVFSWQVYSTILIATSAAQTALWLVAARDGGRLMSDGVGWRERTYRTMRGLAPGLAFAAGFWLASTGRLQLAIWCWVLIVPIMITAGLVLGAKRPAA
jgi:uncharacterized membrane protein